MILRIVKMTFQEDKLAAFHQLFDRYKRQIRQQAGCQHLELHGDPQDAKVRFTYSHWDTQEALDAYRQSELFGKVWPATKLLFAEGPEAFSLQFMERIE